MSKLIESYGSSEKTITIKGRTFPEECLLEDDDGVRIFVVPDVREVRAHSWTKAHAAGARLIAAPFDGPWVVIAIEEYMERRTEHMPSGTYRFAINSTYAHLDVPSFAAYADFKQSQVETVKRDATEGFVHLHAHSEHSALDGLSKISEMVSAAVADGQPALSVDDHGTCAGHPLLAKECAEAGIKPIFGTEAYFIADRSFRPLKKPVVKTMSTEERDQALAEYDASVRKAKGYNHLILWAENDIGLQNIWAANTEAHRSGFWGHPRMDWDVLERFSEGVMMSTACLRGPFADALLNDDEDLARLKMARFRKIYADRMHVELHTNQLPEQIKLNERLVSLAHDFSLPLVAVVDSHYPCADDAFAHRLWLSVQTNKDLQDEGDLFVGEQEYHLMAQAEVRKALSYLPDSVVEESIRNTVAVANRCTAMVRKVAADAPVFSKQGGRKKDKDRLLDLCMSFWDAKIGWKGNQKAYIERFEREMKLIIDKGFCGYFLIVADYVNWCKEHRILVGPGRGSGGGSLVAFLSGITGIDPVEEGLLFERFMTEGRTELPDFDVDFPTSKVHMLIEYIIERWGAENVMRVGTQIRLKNRGVVRKLASVLNGEIDIHWPDIDKISKIIENAESGTAGKGLPWDDLIDQFADELAPYMEKYPLLFQYAEKLVGRLSSYGKHAAGFVISTGEPLTGRFPLRRGEEEDQLAAEFDMNVLADLGLVKFDLLALRTLDTIQAALDFIFERTGEWIDIYAWREEYKDQKVWDAISAGQTLGCFQIETPAMTRIVKRLRPQTMADLADAITLVRPGPQRSGLAETFFLRREGREEVTVPDPRLEPVLARTQGCIIYQEDIMQTCMVLAGYDGVQADTVRSILGKKKTEKVAEQGALFIPACVERGMPRPDVEALWHQMEEFAKYSFNRAHAFGYAVIGYWTAWLKFNYPLEFLAAVLSTVDKDRIPEFVNETRRMGFKILPPDVNVSGKGFMPIGDDTVRYGLDSVKGVGEAKLDAITIGQPYTSWEDFLERSKADSGVIRTLAHVGTFDSIFPNRRALEAILDAKSSGEADRCMNKDDSAVGPNGLPCRFDWMSEPVEITKTGKAKKRKDPPKRCTRGCRQYVQPPPLDPVSIEPYTEVEIREAELELLGAYLSSTPFDRLPDDVRMKLASFLDVESGEVGQPFLIAAMLSKVKTWNDRNGNEMAFLGLSMPDGDLDVTCFKDLWSKREHEIRNASLLIAKIRKNERGAILELVTSA